VPTLALRIAPREVEPGVSPPTGFVRIEAGASRAILLTPDEIDPSRRYPLISVLHGAGRRDEQLAKAYRDEAERRQALFLIPRSALLTWDLIASPERHDLDFLEYAYELIYRRYPVDFERQALIGYSDGASYGLSIGLSNPRLFRAVMSWAAGFVVLDDTFIEEGDPKPSILMEHGTHDPVFPFEAIALPLRARLEAAGYPVHFRIDEGGRHWPSGDFQPEALDWFFSDPWHPRS
jgi:phospholipase/carboxylesterase